jgi:hypothetical protein
MEVNTTTTADPLNIYNYINNFVINPYVFVIIILVIIGYLVLFSSLGNNEQITSGASSDNSGSGFAYGQGLLGIIVIAILIILILINGLQYFFSINVSAYLKNLFTNKPEIAIVVNENKQGDDDDDLDSNSDNLGISFRKQVFNVPGNYYTYDDAKAICNAYDADLANYQQVESAYKNGAEWCNYGWSDGQMALYPTQQKTFDNLQKIKGHENNCGRPGINGGYMKNPNIKYGINCHGYKPKMTPEE